MEVNVKELENSQVELEITVPAAELDKAYEAAYKKVAAKVNIPGFRKGKAPKKIVERTVGQEYILDEAVEAIAPKKFFEAIKEKEIDIVTRPEFDVTTKELGKDLVFKVTATKKPEVKLGDYKGMEVPAQDTTVSDKEVEDELESKRQQQAELVLKEDQPAENGDTVVIDYVGSVDGEKFDGGSADNYSLELGSGAFIPGFEDQLVGHKSGDDVEVKVTFPEEYHAQDLAGKEAVFEVKLHEVKEKQLPEMDDEFAKDVDEDVDTLDELKEKTKKQLQEQKEDAAHAAIEDAAIEAAVNNAETEEIPQAMLDDDTDRQVQQYLMGMQQQGINPKMYFQITGTTEDDLRKQFANDAAKRVKTNLVLEAIVKDANLEATDEDIDAEIKDLASQYGMEEDAVKKALSKDMLSHDIQIKKAVDLVTDSAKQVESKDAEEDK